MRWEVVVLFFVILLLHSCSSQHSDNSSSNNRDHVYKCLGRLHDAGETAVVVPGHFMSDSGRNHSSMHTFSLKRKELNCKKGRFKVVLVLDDDDTKTSRTKKNSHHAKLLRTDPKTWATYSYVDDTVKLSQTGYLQIGNEFFHPEEYCFDQTHPTSSSNELSMFVCNPECYGQRPCITKCCGVHEVWDVKSSTCVPSISNTTSSSSSRTYWTPTLFIQSVDNCVKKLTSYHRSQVAVHLTQRMPLCGGGGGNSSSNHHRLIPLRKIHGHAVQRFRVLWTGEVIVRDGSNNGRGNWSRFDESRYCVDGMVNFEDGQRINPYYSGAFEDQVLLVCEEQVPVQARKKPIPLRYAAMLLVSAVILFVTTLISVLLWDRQNVYEWTVSCEVISMFFLILFVGIAHTVARTPEKSDFGSFHCVFLGVASHFFWLATFFWLFIINFEIWWNFRSLVQLRHSRRWFRFMVYLLVGWGCPLVIVVVGLLLDRTWGLQNEDLDCTNVIVPNYGQLNCYISKRAQGPYLFYPIGVILVFNLVFYLLTVCKMWGYQKKSQAIIQYRSGSQTQPILIFAKLFIVMGVSWIFEILSWALTPTDADKIPLYWVIFDLVTLFQAISIFVIFMWKKEILSRLWYKFPVLKPVLRPLSKLPGCAIVPNERDRLAASMYYNSPPTPNKATIESSPIESPPPPHQQVLALTHI